MKTLVVLPLLVTLAAAQTYEVASIKRAADQTRTPYPLLRGGPGTTDPTLMRAEWISPRSLVLIAYGIKFYQLDAPKWMANDIYDVALRLPDHATREEAAAMLQHLLAERFGLRVHHEMRGFDAYALTAGKDPKLTTGTPGPNKGYPDAEAGTLRYEIHSGTMQQLADRIANRLSAAVLDQTGIEGKWDYGMTWSTKDTGDIPLGVRQAGLELKPIKTTLDVVIVDAANRTPTEN